jgi:hypothetical protein
MNSIAPGSNNFTRFIGKGFILVIATFYFAACSEKAIDISAPSYLRGDMSFQADSLEGFVILPTTAVMLRSIHDSDSIYLEIKIEDRVTLRSVLTNGLSVWIDPKAGRNETYGMTFTAARSEMFLRREEMLKLMNEEDPDSVAIMAMIQNKTWVDAINQRENVIKDVKGTRFAKQNAAWVELNQDGSIVYYIRLGFNQLDVKPDQHQNISVGVISQIHQAQLLGGQQSSGGPPGTGTTRRPQQQAPQRGQMMRTPQVSVNSWIILNLKDDSEIEGSSANGLI